MAFRKVLFAAVSGLLLAAQPVLAQTNGWYVGLAGGANWLGDTSVTNGAVSSYDHDAGWAALGKIGYGFSSIRVEGEVGYRTNDASGTNVSGDTTNWTAMANLLYDFTGMGKFVPYVGVGAGMARYAAEGRVGARTFDDSDTVLAVQGILGANYELSSNWLIGADYRYLTGSDPSFGTNVATTTLKGDNANHTIMFGITYRFGAPAPAPAPAPAAAPAPAPRPAPAPAVQAPPPAPAPARLPETYVVFFAFDKAEISPVAAQVLDRAIADYRSTGMTRIVVEGHADRSGKDVYNQRLSERRAKAVADYLGGKGIGAASIQTAGFGETRPRVPTADGQRNDENRRAEIFLRK